MEHWYGMRKGGDEKRDLRGGGDTDTVSDKLLRIVPYVMDMMILL